MTPTPSPAPSNPPESKGSTADEIFRAHSCPDLSTSNHYDPVLEMFNYAKSLEKANAILREGKRVAEEDADRMAGLYTEHAPVCELSENPCAACNCGHDSAISAHAAAVVRRGGGE